MAMHIDESRRYDQPSAIDDVRFFRRVDLTADRRDITAGDKQIASLIEILRRVDQPAAP
jgi:hypothetical protein